jgi:hypothetical protein
MKIKTIKSITMYEIRAKRPLKDHTFTLVNGKYAFQMGIVETKENWNDFVRNGIEGYNLSEWCFHCKYVPIESPRLIRLYYEIRSKIGRKRKRARKNPSP